MVAVARLEWGIELDGITAHEGLWLATGAAPFLPAMLSDAVTLVGGLWTELAEDGGPSREQLQPRGAQLTVSTIVQFLLEFAQIESGLVSAIFGLRTAADRDPLPPLVSKQITVHGVTGGKGHFSRIHTAFHPQLAVDPNDPRNATAVYCHALLACFQLLIDQLRSSFYSWPGPGPAPAGWNGQIDVGVVHIPAGGVLPATFESATSISVTNRRWGTMRRRGAVVKH